MINLFNRVKRPGHLFHIFSVLPFLLLSTNPWHPKWFWIILNEMEKNLYFVWIDFEMELISVDTFERTHWPLSSNKIVTEKVKKRRRKNNTNSIGLRFIIFKATFGCYFDKSVFLSEILGLQLEFVFCCCFAWELGQKKYRLCLMTEWEKKIE